METCFIFVWSLRVHAWSENRFFLYVFRQKTANWRRYGRRLIHNDEPFKAHLCYIFRPKKQQIADGYVGKGVDLFMSMNRT
jgi:hypothetical protein